MRKKSLQTVFELAKKDERIVFIGSDLGQGVLQEFKDKFPERFFMEGVSEANLVGAAAGLALCGKIVYVNTIATFLTRRCFEQIALDLCLHKTKVRLLGNGGGLVYGPLGPTHLAFEDLSILRPLPHLTILAPADPNEMRHLIESSYDIDGPVYIRISKGGEPPVTADFTLPPVGKALRIGDGKDFAFFTTGITLHSALKAMQSLEAKYSLRGQLCHLSTFKPLDVLSIGEVFSEVRCAVSIEENTLAGGLGSALLELHCDQQMRAIPFKRLGLGDEFPEGYGSQDKLMDKYGCGLDAVEESVLKLLKNHS